MKCQSLNKKSLNKKFIVIHDDANFEGCSQNESSESNSKITIQKDYINFNPDSPQNQDTQYEKKDSSENPNHNSIEGKKTKDGTNEIIEDNEDMKDINNEKKEEYEEDILHNLKDIKQHEKNEEDCLEDNSNIMALKQNNEHEVKESNHINQLDKKDEKNNIIPKFIITNDFQQNKIKIDKYYNDIALGKKRKGRLPNYLKEIGITGYHNNKSTDNAIRCVFTSIKKSVDNFISNLCLEKFGITLNSLNLGPEFGTNYEEYRKFCKKELILIYNDSIPKNIKAYLKEERKKKKDKYKHDNNKALIKNIISKENNNQNLEKKFFILFKKVSFYDMIEVYFDNNKKSIIKDNIKIDLNNFERYETFFNDIYNKEKKEKFKNKIKEILEPIHEEKK